jgi:prepilin-type N-terminal cleavage/methylation domain-containing protein
VRRARCAGFTLIELMIVVAIIGILAAVAIPKFSNLIRKSKEGSTKGNLGNMRSVLSIYYADNEGYYPADIWNSNSAVFSGYLVPKYVAKIPSCEMPNYHVASNNVFSHWVISPGDEHDGTGWIYDGINPGDSFIGTLWVACSHTDTKGSYWTSY